MPPKRRPFTRAHRSQVGDGDFAITYNKSTGRPIRKSTTKTDSPFVDSAIALSEEEFEPSDVDSEVTDFNEDGEGIVAVKPRKRACSSSPPLSEADHAEEPDVDSGIDSELDDKLQTVGTMDAFGSQKTRPLQLTLNVPAGVERQITLNIDLNSLLQQQTRASSGSPRSARKRQKLMPQISKAKSKKPVCSPTASTHAGFLDLPPELRNQIYRLVFVAPSRLDFGSPSPLTFQRSAAFLRTHSTVHIEARSILYSENEFFFQRQSRRHGHIFASDWSELGFRPVRRFLKAIGPCNTSLIRHITLLLEDAAPSLNPQLTSAEDRRFVHDPSLHSILRHLGSHARLRTLYMNFQGRKVVDSSRSNDKFLDLMGRVKADVVEFVKHPVYASQTSYHSKSKHSHEVGKELLGGMVRRKKLFVERD